MKNIEIKNERLTESEVLKYAFYTIATGIGIAVPMSYATIFMTDQLMISAAIVATLLLVARILDFAVSLSAGAIIQKSNLKWGRYRSWLVICRWIVFVGISLQFINTSALPLGVRLVIVTMGYFMLHFSMNFIALSQFGILASMAGTSMEDRTRLSSRQAQAQTLGAIITSATVIPLLNYFTPIVGTANAYIVVAAPFALVFVLGATILVKTSAPYDSGQNIAAAGAPPVTLKDMVDSVITNKQLLVIVLVNTLSMVAMMASMGIAAYYFMYVLGNFTLMAVAMTSTTVFGFFASLLGPTIGRKFGKKRAMVFGFFTMALASVAITMFASSSVIVYIVIVCLRMVGQYSYMCFGVNYVLDAAEYGYNQTGKDSRTVAMSMNNIPIKIGFALGGALGTFGLSFIGYEAGMVASPEFIKSFMWIFGGIPAGLYLLGGLIMLFGHKITDEDAARYAQENAARRAAEAAVPPTV
ncbi:MAG: MFS transporter [Firmicutes bacterium]|nr:MFS transporter [Bacillota bacterium]